MNQYKYLDWKLSDPSKIKVLSMGEPDKYGLVKITYKVPHGRKIYSMWIYPSDLVD
jgi:hypothetical protein